MSSRKEDILTKELSKCKYESSKEMDSEVYNAIIDSMEIYAKECIDENKEHSKIAVTVDGFDICEGMLVHKDYNDGDGFCRIGMIVFCNQLLSWTITDGDMTETLSEYVDEFRDPEKKKNLKFTKQ